MVEALQVKSQEQDVAGMDDNKIADDDLKLLVNKPRTKLTQNMLHNVCPRVDMKKKRDIFALHSKTFQSEKISLFD
jgi:hypothetical protein